MSSLGHTLSDDLLEVFKRACLENEFESAGHLLSALEVLVSKQTDGNSLDAAYLAFIACCDLGTRTMEPKQMDGN